MKNIIISPKILNTEKDYDSVVMEYENDDSIILGFYSEFSNKDKKTIKNIALNPFRTVKIAYLGLNDVKYIEGYLNITIDDINDGLDFLIVLNKHYGANK